MVEAVKVYKEELNNVQKEIKKAKTYKKRSKDEKVLITHDVYISLLDFKRKVLQMMIKEKKRQKQ